MNEDIDSLRVPFDAEKRAELDRMVREQQQRDLEEMIVMQRKHR